MPRLAVAKLPAPAATDERATALLKGDTTYRGFVADIKQEAGKNAMALSGSFTAEDLTKHKAVEADGEDGQYKDGYQAGINEVRLEMARDMLGRGMDAALIAQLTGFTVEQLSMLTAVE